MKTAVFSSKPHDREFLEEANAAFGHELHFFGEPLHARTAVLADGFPAVCVFVNDRLDAEVLRSLAESGTRVIALRCAGFNNIDLETALDLDMTAVRVPAYSPHAVAEHTVGLMLALNRKIHRANNRVREGNFSLDGLMGFDFHGKTAGVVGAGLIGACVARILSGFGCRLIVSDPNPGEACRQLGCEFAPLDDLLSRSDVITLHCPLIPQTRHMINMQSISRMKRGAMLINTSRGALIDARAAVEGLKSGAIGYLGLDVYEEEGDMFFRDLSNQVLQDDVFARLLTFPNVLITGHQAFFTRNALQKIAETTLDNIARAERGEACDNVLHRGMVSH